MTKADIVKKIEALDARLKELEDNAPRPPLNLRGGETEATNEDLLYILNTKGFGAYHEALKVRNRQRARRWGIDKRLRREA